jgi:hypothetical protein
MPNEQEQPKPALMEPTPANMLMFAVQSGRSMEEIKELVALFKENRAEQAKHSFDTAFSDFQLHMPTLYNNDPVQHDIKDRSSGEVVGERKYKFKKLGATALEIRESLHSRGFGYRFSPGMKLVDFGNVKVQMITITCHLTHKDGHSEEVMVEGEPDISGGKNKIQAYKSTSTYLKRIALEAVTGVTINDVDDDGQGGAPVEKRDWTNTKPQKKTPMSEDAFQGLLTAIRTGSMLDPMWEVESARGIYSFTNEQEKVLDITLKSI